MGARMTGVTSLGRSISDITSRWDESAKASVGTNLVYGPAHEFGTDTITPQPYLRPGAERAARNIETFARQANGTAELVMLAALYCEGVAKELVRVDTGALRSSISARRE